VFAAASLRDVFTALASDFEQQHPEARVGLQFAGSQELRVQIEHGARADVFASADEAQVAPLVRAGLVAAPRPFAGNELVVVTPAANPAAIAELWDLPRATRIAIGAPEVPVGRYTERMLDRAAAVRGRDFREAVLARVVSRELNVRQTLAKAVLGEVDAAVVYRTDARAAGTSVRAVAIPEDVNVVTSYFIAATLPARAGAPAQAFIDAVLAPAGQARLAEAGFREAARLVAPSASAGGGRGAGPFQ
jgi:molybdate transport system substrate-binding protein